MQKIREPKQKLIPLNSRHGEQSYNVICDIADEFNCSKAAVVRASTSGHLDEYFGRIRFYDEVSTVEIKEIFLDILKNENDFRLMLGKMAKTPECVTELYHLKRVVSQEQCIVDDIMSDEKRTLGEREALSKSHRETIEKFSKEIAEMEAIPDVIEACKLSEVTNKFLRTLDKKMYELEDIVLQKGSRISDESDANNSN